MVGTANDENATARGVEAVDRLQQAERGHLHEVVERLAAAFVAAREAACERQEPLHERLVRVPISGTLVAREQLSLLECAPSLLFVNGGH